MSMHHIYNKCVLNYDLKISKFYTIITVYVYSPILI